MLTKHQAIIQQTSERLLWTQKNPLLKESEQQNLRNATMYTNTNRT